MDVSYATGIRLKWFQVRWKYNTRGCLHEQAFSEKLYTGSDFAQHTYTPASFVTLRIRCNSGTKESISYHKRLSTGSTYALHVNPTCKRSASLVRGRNQCSNRIWACIPQGWGISGQADLDSEKPRHWPKLE